VQSSPRQAMAVLRTSLIPRANSRLATIWRMLMLRVCACLRLIAPPYRANGRRALAPRHSTKYANAANVCFSGTLTRKPLESHESITTARVHHVARERGDSVAPRRAAQQPERVRRIGVLMNLAADDPEGQARIAAFHQGLQEWGWTLGRNAQIDVRWGAFDADSSRRYAAEVVGLAPDVILASASAAMGALQQTTRTVPIVFVGIVDPVGAGFVESLARPGGNTTGFTPFEYGLSGKWIELLKEIAPGVKRAAVLRDPAVGSGIGLSFFGRPISAIELGGWAIGLVGLFNIVGSLLWGWLGGHHLRKDMLALLYALRALAFVLFLALPLSWISVLLFAASLGFLWLGTVPLTSGLVGYMFGPVHMSMLWGIVFFSHQFGSFLGGWGAGRLYDVQGNYDLIWWISVGLGVFAALIHWLIREQPVERLTLVAVRS
jgi:ABC transporter substrate binding protein